MKDIKYKVAIVGSTGAVGQEMIKILLERNFPVGEFRLIASERSAGKKQRVGGKVLTVLELDHGCFEGTDIAFFSAGSSISTEYAESAVKAGAVVIDNSSAYRMDKEVPLIIPEINPDAALLYKKKGIIANPNCTTTVACMALKPIYDAAGIKRVVATSFQAVSGAGAGGIRELSDQTENAASTPDKEAGTEPAVFPHQIAFNVIPHIDRFQENGYTKEEMKLHHETRKILEDDTIQVSATTVRVPVIRSHCISLNVETKAEISVKDAAEAINSFPGATVLDSPENNLYPMPVNTSGRDECLVGRIRKDYTLEKGISLWAAGDQIRKGAALNAVQIAELFISEHAQLGKP